MSNKMKQFIKSYLQLNFVFLLIYVILGPLEPWSMLMVSLVALPITALITFTGLENKLKTYLP